MRTAALRTLALALVLSAACVRPDEPEFKKLDNVQFAGVDLTRGTALLVADAMFYNPNRVGLEVTKLDLSVQLDGAEVATVTEGRSASVPANADFVLPLEAELPIDAIRRALEDDSGSLLGGLLAGKDVAVRVEGRVRFKVAGIGLSAPVLHEEQVRVKL